MHPCCGDAEGGNLEPKWRFSKVNRVGIYIIKVMTLQVSSGGGL